MVKRVVSTAVGLIILAVVFIFHNLLIINIAVTIVALIGLSEFYNAFKNKGYKPIEKFGFAVTLGILFIGFVEAEILKMAMFFALPVSLFVLFSISIFSNMKYNAIDIAITILGIVYVSFLFSFIPFICHLENGQYYIWYALGGAWMVDIFAYLIGSSIGKHKFSKISPKKSVEGCIAGMIGCVLYFVIYTYYLNTKGLGLSYSSMILLGLLIGAISQIGDFAASSIKRFCDEKDFGTIMPGHGGILDRFDSVIMVAPFVYMYFQIF